MSAVGPSTGREPLVLLPGMNCSRRLWDRVVESLVQQEGPREVHCAPLTGDSIEEMVRHLLDVLPSRFALAGLSLGGIVAMALVRLAPERVSRLCLLDTNAREPTSTQVAAWAASRQALASGASATDLQRESMATLVSPHARSSVEAVVLQMAQECGEVVLDQQLAAQAGRVDERPSLGEIKVPTMIICGDVDALCPVANHEEIHSLVPDSGLVVLPHVGHLSTLESPDQVAQAMVSWLAC